MIKRLYLFLLKSYMGTFLATFLICLFVVLMQFLWKYVDDMVGKGLGVGVLLEFFYYAALSLVPQALPLAILLASLMTFGNFGERLELLAMKAAGISLFRIMRPYLVFISFVCVGAFFFANNAQPKIQIKLLTLLASMRHKTPDVDIPEGSFYDGISGYSVYVRTKDRQHGMLRNLMIYDLTKGFENAVVTAADSGKLLVSEDKKYLILDLYSGESFENLKEQKTATRNVPYRRESFSFKEVLIEFDSNFKMDGDEVASNKHMSKNLARLNRSMDSLSRISDSMRVSTAMSFKGKVFNRTSYDFTPVSRYNLENYNKYDLSAAFDTLPKGTRLNLLNDALREVRNIRAGMDFQADVQGNIDRQIRKHDIERHRKFTLSVACIIFFFIGAPLGAIIRKGGLGMPLVVSVLFFIVYYVIDNWGYKMAREGVWYVWCGIWLSSIILFPLGVILTYQAATDKFISLSEFNIIKKIKGFFDTISSKFKKKDKSVDEAEKVSEEISDISETNEFNHEELENRNQRRIKQP